MNPNLTLALVVGGLTAVTCFVYYLYLQAQLHKEDEHD